MKFSKSINYSIGFIILLIFLTGLEWLGMSLVPRIIVGAFMWVWEKGLIEGSEK